MRDSLLKIYVDRENFEIASTYGSREINYLAKSDDFAVTPFDFIMIVDASAVTAERTAEFYSIKAGYESKEILRNCCEINTNTISYTSVLISNTATDIALQVVAANLYEGIQHIRHGAPTKKRLFCKRFPFKIIERELQMIKLCIALLEGDLETGTFQKEMEEWAERADNYFFKSTNAILSEYPLKFLPSAEGKAALSRIRSAVADIEKSMESGSELERIWKLAYDVHNEPGKILGI